MSDDRSLFGDRSMARDTAAHAEGHSVPLRVDGQRSWRALARGSATHWQALLLFIVVTGVAFLRMAPPRLEYEEPFAFWDIVPTMSPIEYLVEPWAGYLQVVARATFLVAHPFGDFGPTLTRIVAAGVIGFVALYLASEALADAIPRREVRWGFALSLPLLPIPHPGPYVGPLNSQWWIALAVVGIALARCRIWHYPALFAAALVGLAPCVALLTFRDRRAVALGLGVAVQAGVMLLGVRRPSQLAMTADYLPVMLAVAATMFVAPLPARTRASFAYLAIVTLGLGAVLTGWPLQSNLRFVALPGAAMALGVISLLLWRPTQTGRRGGSDQSNPHDQQSVGAPRPQASD